MFTGILKEAGTEIRKSVKEFVEKPVPLGKAILATTGLVIITAVVFHKPIAVVVNIVV